MWQRHQGREAGAPGPGGRDSPTSGARGMLRRMRRRLRNILTWLLGSVIVVIVVAVIGEFFIEVARDKGLYTDAGARWDRLMNEVVPIVTSPWVLYPLTALAGLVGGMWIDTLMRRQEARDGDPRGNALALAGIENPSAWLEQLADADESQMWQRIISDEYLPQANAHLDAPEPYVEFTFWFINATVYTLTNPRLEGWIRYNGHDLQSGPTILDEDKTIKHAQRGALQIKQPITRDLANDLLHLHRSGYNPKFQVTNLVIWFTYDNRHGSPKEVRLDWGTRFQELISQLT